MERAKICGGFDSPNRRERGKLRSVGGRRKERRHVADRWVPHVGDSEEKRGGGWVRDAGARDTGPAAAAGLGPSGSGALAREKTGRC
jgi:hypothetical protein